MRQVRWTSVIAAAVACSIQSGGIVLAAGDAESLGARPRGSVPAAASPATDCTAPLVMHGDQTYETGYAWRTGGQVPP